MKTFCFTAMIAVFMLLCTNGIQAQTTQTTLNQVELMKQILGSWTAEMGKDTTQYIDTKPYGTGMYADFKYVTKDKIILEGKQLYGYDRQMDKFILIVLIKGMDMQLAAMWFTSENIGVVYYYKDIPNLEKASFKMELEFKSPDIMLFKTIVNNNLIKTNTFTRIK